MLPGFEPLASHGLVPTKNSEQAADFLLSEERYENLDPILQRNRIAGMAITEIHNAKSLSRVYGNEGIEVSSKKLTSDSKFFVGSVSKTVAVLVILHLKHRRLIRLEDPVTKFFPNGSVPHDKFGNVTIEHLLTHSCGLGEEVVNVSDPDLDEESWIKSLRDVEVIFSPGRYASVCNLGFRILGYIIKKSSGQSFKEIAEGVLFKEIGLQSAVFGPEGEDQICKGHDFFTHESTTQSLPRTWPEILHPNGGLCISNEELGKYLQYVMNLRNGRLKSALFDPLDLDKCFATHFAMGGASFENMGYHWNVFKKQGQAFYKTSGSNFGMHGFLVMGPDFESGLAININKFASDSVSFGIVKDWALYRYSVNFDFPQVSKTIERSVPGEFSGTYSNACDGQISVDETGTDLNVVVRGVSGELKTKEIPNFVFKQIEGSSDTFLAEDELLYDRGLEFIRENGEISYLRFGHRLYKRQL